MLQTPPDLPTLALALAAIAAGVYGLLAARGAAARHGAEVHADDPWWHESAGGAFARWSFRLVGACLIAAGCVFTAFAFGLR